MTAERRPFLIWLLIITAIGCLLRIYHFTAIPFNYDELSALNRTHFDSFSQLIQQGVAVDGHPAGVQVFIYYWTHLFGDKEWVVKLPFIVMGIACIPLIYFIGVSWFNRNTGILAACFMATLQYTVMFSQLARPYISGVFFILLAVVIWNRVMRAATWGNIVALAVTLALCAYNHYFSLLAAGCIAATGLFVIERKYLLKYTVGLFLALAFFLPHVPLFFTQLKLNGLEWLTVPTPVFFKNYLYYVFNFSNYIVIIVILLLVQGVYLKLSVSLKYRCIALLWFVLPAAIGYFYSVHHAPVLQNSVLIFGFPFLLLFLCSFMSLPDSYLGDVEIGILLLALVLSLTVERNYYTFFYQQETEMFARHILGYQSAYGSSNVAAVVNTNRGYLAYYKKKYDTNWSYTTFDSIGDNNAWNQWLQKCNARYLILCNPPQEWGSSHLPIAREYFPCTDSVYSGFTTDIFILKRDTAFCKPPVKPIFSYQSGDSILPSANYSFTQTLANEQPVSAFRENDRQGIFFSPISKMGLTKKDVITVSAQVYIDSASPQVSLRLYLKDSRDSNKVVDSRNSTVPDYASAGAGWHTVYLTVRLYHSADLKNVDYISAELLSQFAVPVQVKNFKFVVVPDNPFLYVMIQK